MKTLYQDYWGASETEFLETYAGEMENWEKTIGTINDLYGEERTYTCYKSDGLTRLAGAPAHAALEFTDGYGLTSITFFAQPEQRFTEKEYYDALMGLYGEMYELLGKPVRAHYDFEPDAPSLWFNCTDADAFFDLVSAQGRHGDSAELTAVWERYEEGEPQFFSSITSYCPAPFEGENLVFFTAGIHLWVEKKSLT